MDLAKRATNVPNSGIGFMMRYASKYQDVIFLGQGTPLFPTPQFIYDGVYEYGKNHSDLGMYSSTAIEKSLKELVAQQMQKYYGFTPSPPTEILLTTGGIGGLFSAIMSLVEKGDEVIYFDPSYPLHIEK